MSETTLKLSGNIVNLKELLAEIHALARLHEVTVEEVSAKDDSKVGVW
jgi:ribonuclease HI